ncbi:hypothetical protein DFH11DRAFT_1648135 [Phellopilus nigrolimitatus]|nr:hypothetical protein DFH11DRAFT_1648135 [Phellopilus nigrolimitatus]
MSYSLCRFWAYDESKKIVGEGASCFIWNVQLFHATYIMSPGGIAGFVGNLVRLQGDFAKPPEKRLNYKNCSDGFYRMVRDNGPSSLTRAPQIYSVQH